MERSHQETLRVRDGGSWLLGAFVLVIHGTAVTVAWLFPAAEGWRALLAGLVIASGVHSLRMHCWRSAPGAILEAVLDGKDEWLLHLGGEGWKAVRLLPSSYIHPRLLILNFRVGALRRRSLVLFTDSIDAELARKLRVRIRGMRL